LGLLGVPNCLPWGNPFIPKERRPKFIFTRRKGHWIRPTGRNKLFRTLGSPGLGLIGGKLPQKEFLGTGTFSPFGGLKWFNKPYFLRGHYGLDPLKGSPIGARIGIQLFGPLKGQGRQGPKYGSPFGITFGQGFNPTPKGEVPINNDLV